MAGSALVSGMDPRIRTRIHTKMSWIRNTGCKRRVLAAKMKINLKCDNKACSGSVSVSIRIKFGSRGPDLYPLPGYLIETIADPKHCFINNWS